uniref:Chaperone protein DnaK n=1 Tax=Vischeria sp. CAUP Q 202 TaxID=1805947 RepID=A0A1D8RDQ4_9STRA|nr:Hsp70-type chaperone [Vischeria punctata]AOW70859.1 Hsp70-type chaperone [Vischeria sp. CAUP Q 202]UTV00855.1 Hsp70-type chaperone [Vischeria punctata]
MAKVVGIDLGTTNSVVSVVQAGTPIVIPNAEGFRTTPSIVGYALKTKELIVGAMAKRQAVINPENTFYSVKRFIGSKANEIAEESKQVSYKVTEDERKNVKIYCPILDKYFSPEEISSQVLRKLTQDASKFLNEQITKAVITVPAYFNDSQRQATKDAGKIAGLEVLRIINEPTAAALAYGLDKKTNETILIFDLGGGTFDVSILEVGDGVFEVLATAGDTHLGGDDFDSAIMKYILADFESKESITLKSSNQNDKQALQRILEAAEKAKIELSQLSETTISLPYIVVTETGPKHIDMTLTRAKFNELCSSLIHRCEYPVQTAMNDANLGPNNINEIILVGGSTRIPAIQELVQKLTFKKPNLTVNPDEVVAVGAAINGAVLAGEIKDVLLLDVTPLSLGVETIGGLMTRMIERNTTIPATKTEIFSTAEDNQPKVDIHILQGERLLASDNKSLGHFELGNISAAPRGVPQIEVTFDIDADGILSVRARDKVTGQTQSITIQDASTLDRSEVDKLVEEASKNAELDQQRKQKIDVKNKAEMLIYQAEKSLNDQNSPFSEIDKQKIQTLISSLREAQKSENYQELEQKMKDLEEELASIKSN